jgi:hypothetical protein
MIRHVPDGRQLRQLLRARRKSHFAMKPFFFAAPLTWAL